MADTNSGVSVPDAARDEALSPIKEAAKLVVSYAAKLVGDERALQFATTLSIMARQNPKIAQATQESMVSAMMACVQLNLLPNTPEQLAFIIPYLNNKTGKYELQFQVGYKGMIKLIQRSNKVKSMAVELVFEGDRYKIKFGTTRQLIHEPNLEIDRTDYSKVVAAYCTAVLSNGEKVFDVMSRKELDKIRESAKARSTDAPWNTWPEAQAKKTVIKRFSKVLPSSNEDDAVALAAQFDSWAEAAKLQWRENAMIESGASEESKASERQGRIAAAEAERKALTDSDFSPAPVAPATPEN